MQARIAILIILASLGSACTSKPTTGQGKPTAENLPSKTVELKTQMVFAPRRPSPLESALLLDPGVQSCLRQELRRNASDFFVEIAGHVTKKGDLDSFQTRTARREFETCLDSRLKAIELGAGPSGLFKLRVENVIPGKPLGRTKTIVLSLDDSKKLE